MVQRLARAQWGALPPKRAQTRMPTAVGITIHYEGPKMGAYSHSQCVNKVRGIQRFHMYGGRDDWKDTAYNEIVCRHGVRFECRGYGAKSGANGNDKANAGSYAICALIGEGDDVTPELVAGIKDACDDYRRHGAGSKVWGHRDHVATSCCGDPLYRHVKAGTFSPSTPKPTPPVPEEDDDMKLTDIVTVLKEDGTEEDITYAKFLRRQNYAYLQATRIPGLEVNVTALTSVVQTLAQSKGVDPAALAEVVRSEVKARLDRIKVVDEGALQ